MLSVDIAVLSLKFCRKKKAAAVVVHKALRDIWVAKFTNYAYSKLAKYKVACWFGPMLPDFGTNFGLMMSTTSNCFQGHTLNCQWHTHTHMTWSHECPQLLVLMLLAGWVMCLTCRVTFSTMEASLSATPSPAHLDPLEEFNLRLEDIIRTFGPTHCDSQVMPRQGNYHLLNYDLWPFINSADFDISGPEIRGRQRQDVTSPLQWRQVKCPTRTLTIL